MSKLYELRIDSAKMSNMAKALEINASIMPELKTDYPPLGCFTTDIGKLNQYIQIYEYDTYGARYNELKNLSQQNPNWAAANHALRELYDTQESMTMRLTKETKLCMPAAPEGFYFLYKYTFCREQQGSGASTWHSDMERFILKFIKRTGLIALGVWTAELGGEHLSTYYVLYQCADLDSPENPAIVHEYSRDTWKNMVRDRSIKSITGEMMRPTPWGKYWR